MGGAYGNVRAHGERECMATHTPSDVEPLPVCDKEERVLQASQRKEKAQAVQPAASQATQSQPLPMPPSGPEDPERSVSSGVRHHHVPANPKPRRKQAPPPPPPPVPEIGELIVEEEEEEEEPLSAPAREKPRWESSSEEEIEFASQPPRPAPVAPEAKAGRRPVGLAKGGKPKAVPAKNPVAEQLRAAVAAETGASRSTKKRRRPVASEEESE